MQMVNQLVWTMTSANNNRAFRSFILTPIDPMAPIPAGRGAGGKGGRDGMTTRARRQGPRGSGFLGVLGSIVIDQARGCGLSDDLTQRLSIGIETDVRRELGPGCWYIPGPSKTDRDHAILTAFRNGQRLASLAVDFGLTETRVRQILKRTA